MAQQTRYVLNKKDGRLLIWNAEIATNPDYVEVTASEAEEVENGVGYASVLRRKFRIEREEELAEIRAEPDAEEAVEPEPERPEQPDKPAKPLVYKGTPMPPAPPPEKFSAREILNAVGDDPDKASLALEDEESQLKPRKALIRDLKAIIAAGAEAEESGSADSELDELLSEA